MSANFQKQSINSDLWTDEAVPLNTPMRDFYRGKVVFLTGGTGFLGQIYVEKLLRCEVKKVYLLARPKKGKSSLERMSEIFTGALFTTLAKQQPDYMQRIQVVEGNTRELEVGLSQEAQAELCDNVDIILHAAADVRFDNTLMELSLVNLRGTREMLRLAERFKHLQMFAYISTAFAHCVRQRIEEKFYEAPITPAKMIEIAEYYEKHEDADMLEVLTDRFVSPWPNTYSFSKALSEQLIREYGDRVPAVIIRPSIIISTHEDPIPAWCNNIYGLNGMLVACGLGFLRIMVFDRDLKGDVICADFVTNTTLAAIWDRYTELNDGKRLAIQSNGFATQQPKATIEATSNATSPAQLEPKIYNVTAKKDGLTWGKISDDMTDLLHEYPTMKSIWLHRPNTTKYRLLEFFFVIFYHAIPGFLYDCVLKITKNPRRLLPLYRKTHIFMIKLRYFMTQEWDFDNKNILELYQRMSSHDQKFFPSDVRKYNWDEYRYNYHLGLLRYIGLETLADFGPARKRMLRFRIAHFFVLIVYYTMLASIYYFVGHMLGINNIVRSWIHHFNY